MCQGQKTHYISLSTHSQSLGIVVEICITMTKKKDSTYHFIGFILVNLLLGAAGVTPESFDETVHTIHDDDDDFRPGLIFDDM
jgi:hypothetical protein